MAKPSGGYKLEVEFVLGSGTWFDLTSYVEWSQGVTITVGRATPFEGVQPSTLSLTLNNADGRFTPNRQYLNDGSTPNTYWPNVLPRRRVRFSWRDGSTRYQRFFGYVNGWPPSYLGTRPVVLITATDRLKQMKQVKLLPPLQYAIGLDDPDFYWPLTDEVGSRSADEITGNTEDLQVFFPTVNFSQLTFGSNPGGYADGPAAVFKPDSNAGADGQFLFASLERLSLDWTDLSIEVWFYVGHKSDAPAWFTTTSMVLLSIITAAADQTYFIAVDVSQVLHGIAGVGAWGIASPISLTDAKWHQIVITLSSAHARIYVDGALADTDNTTSDWTNTANPLGLVLGAADLSTGIADLFAGGLRSLAIWKSVLTSGQIADHYTAGTGFVGETVDDRMTRWFDTAAIPSAEYTVDTSTVPLNTYPQTGADITDAMTDTALSEGGGAVFFVDPLNGKMTFHGRRYRDTLTSVMTLDADLDVARDEWQPAYDDSLIVNRVNGQRSTFAGVASTQTVVDHDSVDAYGIASQDLVSYAQFGSEVRYEAEELVARGAQPRMRLSQVTVDLWTSPTSGIYAQVGAATLSSRMTVDNLPIDSGFFTDSLDLFVEGWTETITASLHRVRFNTSPAEPRRALAGTARAAASVMTLHADVTAGAAALLLDPNNDALLSSAAMPFDMQIGGDGGEIVTVTSQLGGIFGGVQTVAITRGMYGTPATVHHAGDSVQLWPLDTAAL